MIGGSELTGSYQTYGATRARLLPLGDAAVTVRFGEEVCRSVHDRVRRLADDLERHRFPGMIEYVPAYLSVTVYYDPLAVPMGLGRAAGSPEEAGPFELVADWLAGRLAQLGQAVQQAPRVVELPVCYGGELGPDLPEVAAYHGLTEREVIDIHASADYLVFMLGFAPGFAYLGGLSPAIATPRRRTPRLSIPAGSVGIAGEQTGVYPLATPGGWQLIGRTPQPLFLPDAEPPTLLRAGDIVRFRPISREEFERREGERR